MALALGLAGDEAAREDAACDFGGMTRRLPAVVVRPRTYEEVVRAVRFAQAEGIAVAGRGQGHSTRGHSLVEGGIVVDMGNLDRVEVDGPSAIVGAGARWDAVLRATLCHGLTPPTLTDYLGLSVGGTLSVGGVGGQSFRHGLQTDNVEELTVVTGRGEVVVCSPERHVDLFDACRAGLGQCALIVGARLKLVRAPVLARVFRLSYTSLAAWLDEQMALAERGSFDYLLGSILPSPGNTWTFSLEATKYLAQGEHPNDSALLDGLKFASLGTPPMNVSYAAYANRLEAMVAAMTDAGTRDAYHPWMDLFLPARAAREIIASALVSLDPRHLEGGHMMTYPLASAASSTPLVPIPMDRYAFLFDILPSVRRGDEARLRALEVACRRIFERAREVGGRIYPIGYPVGTDQMGEADWRQHFGAHWGKLRIAKQLHDPRGLLTPGPGVFAPSRT